jgi:hypothetical protein
MTRPTRRFSTCALPLVLVLTTLAVGCHRRGRPAWFYEPPTPPQVLGHEVDMIMRTQEDNAEAAKFIIYVHEFKLNDYNRDENKHEGGWRLNEYGEDHVARIAERIRCGVNYPVVIERSQTTVWEDSEYKYPIHFNPELDLKRREVVVRALTAMGIHDADQRVVVAPAFVEGYTDAEAERAYNEAINAQGGFGFGFGGFGVGFGPFGFGSGFF